MEDVNIQYYLVYKKQIPVGYLKLNFGEAQNEHIHKSSLEIERLYVVKEYQNQNIGQFLIEKAFAVAKQNKLVLVWLGVWEKNPGGIKFYKRNGFVEFDKHLFLLGMDEQTDILMKLEI